MMTVVMVSVVKVMVMTKIVVRRAEILIAIVTATTNDNNEVTTNHDKNQIKNLK